MIRHKGKRLNQYVPDYIVFDLETTGISIQHDTIIEISAIKVKGGKVIEEFSTLVNPGRLIPAAATAVNGITNAMVAGAPGLEEVMKAFLEFIGDGILVGHNIHSFDTNFVYDAALEYCGKQLCNDYVDTLYLARQNLPQLPKHSLGAVAQYFHISTDGAHRALNDCRMNQAVFEALGKIKTERTSAPVKMCPVCGCELIRRKGRFGEFLGCSSVPGCRYTENISRPS